MATRLLANEPKGNEAAVGADRRPSGDVVALRAGAVDADQLGHAGLPVVNECLAVGAAPAVRLEASDMKATKRPSALTDASKLVAFP
jgi:hypothetical protein